LRIQIRHTPEQQNGVKLARQFVEETLIPNLKGIECNKIITVLLGGSNAKNLNNSRSDLDLTLYYNTSIENLVKFNRKTLTVHNLKQLKQEREQVFYEWDGLEVELGIHPWRRIGQGFDLAGALHSNNTKTLHDWVHHYPVYTSEDYKLIDNFIKGPNYEWSLDLIVGYTQGYATSQLLMHKRRIDYADRERTAINKNDITPVIKHIMNGLYIGLSGLYLLDNVAVSRDFLKLWQYYEHNFSKEEQEFVYDAWRRKTDLEHEPVSIGQYIQVAADLRVSIFTKIKDLFITSTKDALENKRFNEHIDRAKNDKELDILQEKILFGRTS